MMENSRSALIREIASILVGNMEQNYEELIAELEEKVKISFRPRSS